MLCACLVLRLALQRLSSPEAFLSVSEDTLLRCFVAYECVLSFSACFALMSLLEPFSEAEDLGMLVFVVDAMRRDLKAQRPAALTCTARRRAAADTHTVPARPRLGRSSSSCLGCA